MSRSEKRKAVENVAFRLDPQQATTATEKADRHGLSLGQYARHLLIHDLGQTLPVVRRAPPRDRAELRKIAAHLGKIGKNINDVAEAANTPGRVINAADIARAKDDLAAFRSMLASALHVREGEA